MSFNPIKIKNEEFDILTYQECDPKGKDTCMKYLAKHGILNVDPREKKKGDLLLTLTNWYEVPYQFYYEVEIKRKWIPGNRWPKHWAELNIPARKKLARDNHKPLIKFWVISGDRTYAWEVEWWELKDSIIRPKRVKDLVGPGYHIENFFWIPIEKCKLINLEEDYDESLYQDLCLRASNHQRII